MSISLQRAGEITDHTLATLEPQFKLDAIQWMNLLKDHWIIPYVYCGLRDDKEQAELYEKYKHGGPLAAPPGKSWHSVGMAIDWVSLKKTSDNPDLYEPDWDNDDVYRAAEALARTCNMRGIEEETGHIQSNRYATIEEAKEHFAKTVC